MSDWDELLRDGRAYQYEKGLMPPVRRPPSMVPWVILAVSLILISLGIELFWPLPGHHGRLPTCQDGQPTASTTVSCQKQSPAPSPTAQ